MAFNWQTFKTRALTAIVFAGVMLLGLLWNHWSFLLLFSIIHFGCWWEYLKLADKIHLTPGGTGIHPYIKLGLMVFGYGLMLGFCSPAYHFNGYGIKENISLPVSAAGFVLWLIGIFQKNPVPLKWFAMAAIGLVYLSLCWGLMISLYNGADLHLHDTNIITTGNFIPIIIIVSIWINDTMAYIIGSLIGKTPFSKISPKKTWEGTMGGIILCVVVMAFLYPRILYSTGDTAVAITVGSIALIAAVFGTAGDLLESKLKRMAGVKDSGALMPGHGGFMDRFDSLLLATPFVWIYVQLVMR